MTFAPRGAAARHVVKKKKTRRFPCGFEKNPGNVLLSHDYCHSTIAAEALHFRVRYGNGCYRLAMATGKN